MPTPDYEDDLVFPPNDWMHLKCNHFVELTEKVKKQGEELQQQEELYHRSVGDIYKLRQLLKECSKWITDIQNHCYLGIGARFDKSVDLLTRINEVLK